MPDDIVRDVCTAPGELKTQSNRRSGGGESRQMAAGSRQLREWSPVRGGMSIAPDASIEPRAPSGAAGDLPPLRSLGRLIGALSYKHAAPDGAHCLLPSAYCLLLLPSRRR